MSAKETFDCIIPSNLVLRCEGELQSVLKIEREGPHCGFVPGGWIVDPVLYAFLYKIPNWVEVRPSMDFLKVLRA
jgi:hypothetical protein